MDTVAKLRFRAIAVISFLCAAVLMVLAWPRADPADEAPKPIRIALGMTVRDFVARNGLRLGERESHGFAIDADNQSDVTPIFYDDNWLAVRYEGAELGFDLPAGRTLILDQEAGRIRSFSANLFAHALPLGEMNEQLKPILDRLSAAGWVARTPTTFPLARQDLNELTGSRIIAQMKPRNSGYPRLEITVSDLGQVPPSESWIVSGSASPNASEGRYVVQVQVANRSPGYDELIYPRRIFVNGDKEAALPLSVWIEDPDWTPAAAGMVPVPPERRPRTDWSNWEMPQR